MSREDRITTRIPRFYRNWDKTSLVSSFVQSICKQIDETEQGVTKLLEGHWVDTAKDQELERIASLVRESRLPNEDDEHFRERIKTTIILYKGGGTISVILDELMQLTNAQPGEIEIIENPVTEATAEYSVIANNTWTLSSSSIEDEQPTLTLAVEEEGEVTNPQLINIDTNLSITYEGKLKTGERLSIGQKKSLLDEQDITGQVKVRGSLKLLRKESVWKYTEALLDRIGIFDTARFNDHIFSTHIPAVNVQFRWKRRQPATFLIKVKTSALTRSGLSETHLEKVLKSRKAVGINAIIEVTK